MFCGEIINMRHAATPTILFGHEDFLRGYLYALELARIIGHKAHAILYQAVYSVLRTRYAELGGSK